MPPGAKLIAVGVFSPFFVPLKVLMMAGVLLALPWLMYQAWAFVAPGLYGHEKRLALPLIFFGSVLAYGGIAFVQFFVLDKMFAFIQGVTPASVSATPDIASYVEAILGLYIAFGVAFQVPIVVVLLARMNIVSIEKLKEFRGYFIVLSFVIAAVITPPDVISQLALAIPMCLLYEAGIWAQAVHQAHARRRKSRPATPSPESGGGRRRPGYWFGARCGRGRTPGATSMSSGWSRRCTRKRAATPGLRAATAVSSSDTLHDFPVRHCGDHVTRPDAGLGRRAVLQHAGNDDAASRLHAEGLGQFRRQLVRLHADPAARDLPSLTSPSITRRRWTPGSRSRCPCCRRSANRSRC
jgi:sec-independent protein translocase protein TatC